MCPKASASRGVIVKIYNDYFFTYITYIMSKSHIYSHNLSSQNDASIFFKFLLGLSGLANNSGKIDSSSMFKAMPPPLLIF